MKIIHSFLFLQNLIDNFEKVSKVCSVLRYETGVYIFQNFFRGNDDLGGGGRGMINWTSKGNFFILFDTINPKTH